MAPDIVVARSEPEQNHIGVRKHRCGDRYNQQRPWNHSFAKPDTQSDRHRGVRNNRRHRSASTAQPRPVYSLGMAAPDLAFFNIAGRDIAYRLRPGARPQLLFLPGYASDMEGTKALALDVFAERRGLGMVRFDYSGTGSSSGRFEDGTLAGWLEEALAVIDQLTEGPLILIGSSMGGWIALHLALLRPERMKALVGIAPAP